MRIVHYVGLLGTVWVVFNFIEVHLVGWSLIIVALIIVGSGGPHSRHWIRELDEHVRVERVLAMARQMLLAVPCVLRSQMMVPAVR